MSSNQGSPQCTLEYEANSPVFLVFLVFRGILVVIRLARQFRHFHDHTFHFAQSPLRLALLTLSRRPLHSTHTETHRYPEPLYLYYLPLYLYLYHLSHCNGRFSSRPFHFVPTAPHATTTNLAAHAPSTSFSTTASTQRPLPTTTTPTFPRGAVLPQSPFRNKAANSLQRPLRRLSAARLWNPTNSSRGLVLSSSSSRAPSGPLNTRISRGRAPSSPPPPNVPLSHPALHASKPVDNDDPIGTGAGDYPLLSLPEQRQLRHSASGASPRASLQVERAGSEKRVSLPRSVRHSYDSKRLSARIPAENTSQQSQPSSPFGLSFDIEPITTTPKLDKGKGKAIDMPAPEDNVRASVDAGRGYSKDLERGPAVLDDGGNSHHMMANRNSTVSMPDGIGSAISSSNSSIMGDPEVQPGDMMGGEEWGPQHPCFPHRNPHVSIDDPEYITTRIIRIRRDWLILGDLAPTFSNLYPEILDPAGMSEQEFRRVVEKLNRELTQVFEPWSLRNVVDGVLGLVTGWLWEDLGMTAAKGRLAKLEKWIEQWNDEMARNAEEGGPVAPKIIPLRQTGYMTLDIQIGDPEIAPAPPSTPARSHHAIEATA